MYHACDVVVATRSDFLAYRFNKICDRFEGVDEDNPKILTVLGAAQFFTGQFMKAFKTYDKFFNDPKCVSLLKAKCGATPEQYDDYNGILYEILKGLREDFPLEFPQKIDLNYPQSFEDSVQDYDEFIEFQRLIADPNRDERMRKLRESSNPVHNAKYYYFLAEDGWHCEDYRKAYICYYEAAKKEDQKALYYGFAGNMLLKMCFSENCPCVEPFLYRAADFFHRAIALDGNNSRWHLYESLILTNLAKVTYPTLRSDDVYINFRRAAYYEILKARELVREDQKRLKSAIDGEFDGFPKAFKLDH